MAVVTRFLNWALSYWHSKPTNTNVSSFPLNFKTSHLEELPLELLYEIADYLAPIDRSCLSLCSRGLFNVIGSKHRLLQPKTEPWQIFLQRLSQDLPRYFYCYACSVLHRCEDIRPPGPMWHPRVRLPKHGVTELSPWLWWSVNMQPVGSIYDFFNFHLELAMKRYYCGPAHGISTESLAYIEVQTSDAYPLTTSLLSVDAQICQGPCLCLRIQSWALLKDFKLSSLHKIEICAHLNTQDAPIARIVQMELDACNGSNPRSNSILNTYRCHACGIDYQMEVVDCDKEGVALIITKWLDLGPGLDPTDSRWRRHLFGWETLREIEATQSDGRLRSLFEQESAFPLDALTRRNASLLKKDVFLRKMYQLYANCWALQGDECIPGY